MQDSNPIRYNLMHVDAPFKRSYDRVLNKLFRIIVLLAEAVEPLYKAGWQCKIFD